MLSDLPLYYWDSCVMLSYINGMPGRLPHIEGLMLCSGKDLQIVTSLFSITEVAFAKLEQDKKALDAETEQKIAKLWFAGSPIQLIEFYELLAQRAAKLIRAAVEEDWSLKPGDAIHLATADHFRVKEFHTYDEKLDKFKKITETHFDICRPIATQPVLVSVTPSTKEMTEVKGDSQIQPTSEATSIAKAADPVQGSSSGPAKDQAGAEGNKKEDGEEKMNHVIDLFGVCEADICKRKERRIDVEADKVTVRDKTYHRGCEPTPEELQARDRAPS